MAVAALFRCRWLAAAAAAAVGWVLLEEEEGRSTVSGSQERLWKRNRLGKQRNKKLGQVSSNASAGKILYQERPENRDQVVEDVAEEAVDRRRRRPLQPLRRRRPGEGSSLAAWTGSTL